jgi:hypothetical protein
LRSFAPFAVNKVLAMPFIPHTEEDVSVMLGAIGAASIEELFDEIPPALKTGKLKDVPDGLPEMAVARLMQERASQDGFWSNFIGAGVYEHHIPGGDLADHHARRVLFRLHALPGRGLAGHAAADLRIPDHDDPADRARRVECVLV